MNVSATSATAQPQQFEPHPSNSAATESLVDSGVAYGEELIQKRTAQSKTFQNSDGTYTTELFTTPVHYQDDNGNWNAINNTLVASDEPGYVAENKANDYTLLVPQDTETQPIRVESDDAWVAFSEQLVEGAPIIHGSEVVLNSEDPDVKLEYQAQSNGVKENIVLAAPPTSNPRWTFDLDTSNGLTPNLTQDGGLTFTDATGATVFHVDAPYMLDSSAGEGSYSADVEYSLQTASGEGWVLVVSADRDWLTSPERTYPVRIDPTIEIGPPASDCWINQASPTARNCGPNSDYVRVGMNDGSARRGLLRFDLASIPRDATISDADLQLYLDHTKSLTDVWSEYTARRASKTWTSDATWLTSNGSDNWSEVGGDFIPSGAPGKDLNGSATGFKSLPALAPVQAWVDGTKPNYGFIVKQRAETDRNVLFFFSANSADASKRPKLVVSYAKDAAPDEDSFSACPEGTDQFCLPVGIASDASVATADIIDDPDTAVTAVEQSLLAGQEAAARAFIEERDRHFNDAAQDQMEALLQDGVTTEQPEEEVVKDSELQEQTPSVVITEVGDGPLFDREVRDIRIFEASPLPGGTRVVTHLRGEWRVTLEGFTIQFGADLDVVSGAPIDLQEHRCRIRFKRSLLPDITKHTWGNCADSTRGGFARQHPTLARVIEFTGTRGESYHNDFMIRFNPLGPAPSFQFGESPLDDYHSAPWRYPDGGGSPRFQR